MGGSTIGFLWFRADTMTVLCLLLFVGAMGKSAQLGLHTWLPDAMEGPTPVSALIHAATMVTAGVFMVCRLSPMFETSPVALAFVTTIGAATCLFAATVALVQTDIKRVIAYSTCSQLGYMFFAAGVGAYGSAMFHLFTHAFFKALLFLGAGSVIHAMHHEQDMRFYGGLRKKIPVTFWGMMAGTLAITGVGIPGVWGLPQIGFAGFHSKDAIIEGAWASGNTGVWIVGVLVALLTSFYSWRLMFLTFWGTPRWAASEHIQHALHDAHGHGDHAHDAHHDDHGAGAHHGAPMAEDAGHTPSTHGPAQHELPAGTGGYHPHESPINMLIPLIVLSVGAIAAGFVEGGDRLPRASDGGDGGRARPHQAGDRDRDAAGAVYGLVCLYPRPRLPRIGRAAFLGAVRFPAAQMVFRRIVRPALRAARLRDRAAAVASRRRTDDQPLRPRRVGMGRADGQPRRRPPPDGICLHLCLRHADRAHCSRYVGDRTLKWPVSRSFP